MNNPTTPSAASRPDADVEERKRYLRLIWCSAIGFPALTMLTAWELRRFEAGQQNSVRLWIPLAFVYDHFGYWPTILSLPVLGALCIGVFIYKIRSVRNSR